MFFLADKAGEDCRRDQEQWFFFNPQQEKEANGGRPNRITTSGYWKATGSPSVVYSSQNQEIGVKKTMVFYTGKAPAGNKTKWKVNEYKAIASGSQRATPGELPLVCITQLIIYISYINIIIIIILL